MPDGPITTLRKKRRARKEAEAATVEAAEAAVEEVEEAAPVSPSGPIANVVEKATGEPFVAARLFPGDEGYVKDSLSEPDTEYAVKHRYTGTKWTAVDNGSFYRRYSPTDHESASNLKLAISDIPKE